MIVLKISLTTNSLLLTETGGGRNKTRDALTLLSCSRTTKARTTNGSDDKESKIARTQIHRFEGIAIPTDGPAVLCNSIHYYDYDTGKCITLREGFLFCFENGKST